MSSAVTAPNFQTVRLSHGRHSSPRHGVCVAELASMLAGERFSDRPRTACPVVGAFLRGYNDGIDDPGRQDLLPLAAELVDSRADPETTDERARRVVAFGTRVRRLPLCLPGAAYANPLTRYEAIGLRAGRRARRDPRLHADALELVHTLLTGHRMREELQSRGTRATAGHAVTSLGAIRVSVQGRLELQATRLGRGRRLSSNPSPAHFASIRSAGRSDR